MTQSGPRTSTLDRATFDAIASLAYKESGLTLVPEKTAMVQSRLRHRLQALGMNDFGEYSMYVGSDAGRIERRQLISALTTNVSQFFRETHHFDEICEKVAQMLPDLRAGGRFRIWSAGCSNGQEPLSAAIALIERMPEIAELDLRILATDIDSQVISFARCGCYFQRQMTAVPKEIARRYFTPCSDTNGELISKVHPKLLSMIHYKELNLLARWPMKQAFDAIFCRNVVIYFDLQTQEALWPRFHETLAPSGLLFLGHSERIADPAAHQFAMTGSTTYRRALSSSPPDVFERSKLCP